MTGRDLRSSVPGHVATGQRPALPWPRCLRPAPQGATSQHTAIQPKAHDLTVGKILRDVGAHKGQMKMAERKLNTPGEKSYHVPFKTLQLRTEVDEN